MFAFQDREDIQIHSKSNKNKCKRTLINPSNQPLFYVFVIWLNIAMIMFGVGHLTLSTKVFFFVTEKQLIAKLFYVFLPQL